MIEQKYLYYFSAYKIYMSYARITSDVNIIIQLMVNLVVK